MYWYSNFHVHDASLVLIIHARMRLLLMPGLTRRPALPARPLAPVLPFPPLLLLLLLRDGGAGVRRARGSQVQCLVFNGSEPNTQDCRCGFPGADDFVECSDGDRCSAASGTCFKCADGQYSSWPISSAAECSPCPPGKHRELDLANTQCDDCPAGTWSDDPSPRCKICPAGRFTPPTTETGLSSDAHCELCPTGWFNDMSGLEVWSQSGDIPEPASCKSCEAGRYNNLTGMGTSENAVVQIPTGEHAVEEHWCRICDDGFYSGPGATLCTACPKGRALATPEGTEKTAENHKGIYLCEICKETDLFQDETGQPTCKHCPEGATTLGSSPEDSDSLSDCRIRNSGGGVEKCTNTSEAWQRNRNTRVCEKCKACWAIIWMIMLSDFPPNPLATPIPLPKQIAVPEQALAGSTATTARKKPARCARSATRKSRKPSSTARSAPQRCACRWPAPR